MNANEPGDPLRTKFHDLEEARLHLAALKELFLQASRADAHTLRRISVLSNAAHAALHDPYCSFKIATLAGRPELGLAQVLDLFDLIESRISTIELIRRASRASITH